MTTAQLFKALGDPTRLKIVEALSNGSTQTLSSLSQNFDMSRQGARKQIQTLIAAEIVSLKPMGREMQVVLNTAPLIQGKQFISDLEKLWDKRLTALKDFVENDFS